MNDDDHKGGGTTPRFSYMLDSATRETVDSPGGVSNTTTPLDASTQPTTPTTANHSTRSSTFSLLSSSNKHPQRARSPATDRDASLQGGRREGREECQHEEVLWETSTSTRAVCWSIWMSLPSFDWFKYYRFVIYYKCV